MTFTDEATELAAYEGRHRSTEPEQVLSHEFDADWPAGAPGQHRDNTLGAQLLDDAIRSAAHRIAHPDRVPA